MYQVMYFIVFSIAVYSTRILYNNYLHGTESSLNRMQREKFIL
jgi:hypothetical protein